MIPEALRALDEAELVVLARDASMQARAAAEKGLPRLAGWYHALAVTLAEEQDRRSELLEALDPDLDDQDEGEIVS